MVGWAYCRSSVDGVSTEHAASAQDGVRDVCAAPEETSDKTAAANRQRSFSPRMMYYTFVARRRAAKSMFETWPQIIQGVVSFGLGVYFLAIGKRDNKAKSMMLGAALVLIAFYLSGG